MKNVNILDTFNIVRKDAAVWIIIYFLKISLILYAFIILLFINFLVIKKRQKLLLILKIPRKFFQ